MVLSSERSSQSKLNGAWNESLKFVVQEQWSETHTVSLWLRSSESRTMFSPLRRLKLCRFVRGQLGRRKGVSKFILENDSLQITSALLEPSLNSTMVGPIVEDAKALLRSGTGVTLSHIRRQANGVAHHLVNCSSG